MAEFEKCRTIGRLVYIEPNDLAGLAGVNYVNGYDVGGGKGYPDNVFWNPEELNMSVDLQVIMPDRTDCGMISYNDTFLVEINNSRESDIGRYVSFLQGSDIKDKKNETIGHELTTSYLEASYMELKKENGSNKESIGIESIDITFDSHFYPQVNIKFIDIRGYSLMMPTEEVFRQSLDDQRKGKKDISNYNNFFRALFRFPYPRFLLTIKGYYGNSITFILAVNEFKNSFNSQTGNFEVTVSFIGYMYGLYTDIPFNFLLCAPYLGRSLSDNGTTSEWNSQNYKFDSGNGGEGEPICTFVEYIGRFNNLNVLRYDVETGNSEISELNDAHEIQELYKKYDQLSTYLQRFLSSFKTMLDTSDKKVIYNENGATKKDVLLVAGSGDEGNKFKFDAQAWNGFVRVFYDLKATDTEFKISENGEEGFYDYETHKYTEVSKDYVLANKDYDQCFDNSEPDSSNKAFIYAKKNKTAKFKMIWFFDTVNSIEKRMSALEADGRSNAEVVDSKLNDLYKMSLGFVPSVQNYFRMIFAHMDCFMRGFYEVLNNIKKDNRKVSDIAEGKLLVDMTDLNEKMTKDAFLPPFPAMYHMEDGGKKRVEFYPEEIDGTPTNMREIIYVNNLLNAALALKTDYNDAIIDGENDMRMEQERRMALDNDNPTFTPTAMTDFYHTKNPYAYLRLSASEENTMGHLLYFVFLRFISMCFQLNKMEYVEPEAQNFLAVHPTPPNEKFKQDINTLIEMDDSKCAEEICKLVVEYKNSKEGLFGVTEGTNHKLCIRNKYIPLYFDGETEKNGNPSYYSNKNSDEKLCCIFPSGYEGRISDFSSRCTNDLKGRISTIPTEIKFERDDNGDIIHNKEIDNFFIALFVDNDKQLKYAVSEYFYSDNFKNITDINKQCAIFINSYLEFLNRICYDKKQHSHDSRLLINLENKTYIASLQYLTILFLGAYYLHYYDGIFNERLNYSPNGENLGYCLFALNGKVLVVKGMLKTYSYSISEKCLNIIKNDTCSKICSDFFKDFVKNKWKEIYGIITNPNNYIKHDSSYRGNSHIKQVLNYITNESLTEIDRILIPKDNFYYIYNIEKEAVGDLESFIYIKDSAYKKFLTKLQEAYKDQTTLEKTNETVVIEDTQASEGHKLAIYKALKNLYDKWANSYSLKDFELRSPTEDHAIKEQRYVLGETNIDGGAHEFDNFVFMDSFYNDISHQYLLNPDTVYQLVKQQVKGENNFSVYEFMADLCQKNRLLFLALPVMSNFYNINGLTRIFTPQIQDTMKMGIGSTYVCMYTYEVSHVLADECETSLCDDGIDIAGITEDPSQIIPGIPLFGNGDNCLNFMVPAFGVSYAKQNQQYFKTVNVNMDNPRITDYSIANLFELTNLKSGEEINKPYVTANDVYSIYANRSYNCTIEMMGCANIMPLMYFQLNNIPMFRGLYMITNVEHHIRAGNFVTQFSGVRISRNQLPYIDDVFSLKGLTLRSNGLSDGMGLQGGMRWGNYSYSSAKSGCEDDGSGNKRVVNYYPNPKTKLNDLLTVIKIHWVSWESGTYDIRKPYKYNPKSWGPSSYTGIQHEYLEVAYNSVVDEATYTTGLNKVFNGLDDSAKKRIEIYKTLKDPALMLVCYSCELWGSAKTKIIKDEYGSYEEFANRVNSNNDSQNAELLNKIRNKIFTKYDEGNIVPKDHWKKSNPKNWQKKFEESKTGIRRRFNSIQHTYCIYSFDMK